MSEKNNNLITNGSENHRYNKKFMDYVNEVYESGKRTILIMPRRAGKNYIKKLWNDRFKNNNLQ